MEHRRFYTRIIGCKGKECLTIRLRGPDGKECVVADRCSATVEKRQRNEEVVESWPAVTNTGIKTYRHRDQDWTRFHLVLTKLIVC